MTAIKVRGESTVGAPEVGSLRTSAYKRVLDAISQERCVFLDGGTATELDGIVPAESIRRNEEALWGTWALIHNPDAVRAVHRRYAEIGCNVITTNTWGLTGKMSPGESVHWMEAARRGVEVARQAIDEAERDAPAAVAFGINGDVRSETGREFIRLLPRALERHQPDLFLVETITLIRDGYTREALAELAQSGIPVWASFRRCRSGVCGIHGQHWGGPEGDDFGRTARQLEKDGIEALLLNCIPPDHVPGMLPWLRDFTDLPLGVYPNLGYATADGWSSDTSVDPEDYADVASGWRSEGAQILGGCCGVTPAHLEAARERVEGQPIGEPQLVRSDLGELRRSGRVGATWKDAAGTELFPLPLPEIVCEPGVFVPTQGSFLAWKHIFRTGLGRGLDCLDIGCGTGLLTAQLALNGAASVHALDLDSRAAANTLSNAFRNGVSDRVTAETADLFEWVPRKKYELLVASLYQMPVDPYEEPNSHRPLDFWGRNLVDHLLAKLPVLLAEGGRAYLMLLSVLSQERTSELLDAAGFECRVVDFGFFEFHDLFQERARQIERVEEISDAYHLRFGDSDTIVTYLLEINRKGEGPEPGPGGGIS